MKTKLLLVTAIVIAISGCATSPPVLNPNGKPVKFSGPILGKSAMTDARYVLLEKSIADGRFKIISISKTRQPITNERQERVAFNADLTAYAPDYTDYSFRTHVDSGNYNQETVTMTCAPSTPPKTEKYSPCNSAFGNLFIPTGVTKAYVAGQLSAAAMKSWEDPAQNRVRYVDSPKFELAQAGVFTQLVSLSNAN